MRMVTRHGALTLANRVPKLGHTDAEFVAGSVPGETSLGEVERLAAEIEAADGGLLIAWKPW